MGKGVKTILSFRLFIFVVLVLASAKGTAQQDTTAHLDAKGRKQGYFKVFLDSNAHVTDSANAFFIAYEFYSAGHNAFDFYKENWKKKDSAVFVGADGIKGQPQPVNGKFTWYHKKSQMITHEELYQNGYPARFKEVNYKKKNGRYTWALIKTWDFTKRYRAEPGTYLIEEQNNQAIYNLPEWGRFWYRQGKRGWKKYRIS